MGYRSQRVRTISNALRMSRAKLTTADLMKVRFLQVYEPDTSDKQLSFADEMPGSTFRYNIHGGIL